MKHTRHYYCYILASQRNGTLYIGVTNDLLRRVYEHQIGAVKGFTQKYKIGRLVWYEVFQTIEEAITCEKRIKKWKRQWKLNLIESVNPLWDDLYSSLI